jgi:hypothetical protein
MIKHTGYLHILSAGCRKFTNQKRLVQSKFRCTVLKSILELNLVAQFLISTRSKIIKRDGCEPTYFEWGGGTESSRV